MGDAGFAEELGDWECPGARSVICCSAGFQFGSPFGHRGIGPVEGLGNFLQLPAKGKWPRFLTLDPLQGAIVVVEAGQEKLCARADRQEAEIQSKSGSKWYGQASRKT